MDISPGKKPSDPCGARPDGSQTRLQTLEKGGRNTVGLARAGCKIISPCTLTHGPQVLTGAAASRQEDGSPGSGSSPSGTKKEPH